jgi:hypothetical protein
MLCLLATAFTVAMSLAPGDSARAPAPAPLEPDVAHALIAAPTRHVRALDPLLAGVLAEGIIRSPTFGQLVADLERTDVIVQIVSSAHLPSSIPGRTLLVPGAKAYRYVRIQMRPEGSTHDLIETMGHELQHAREIAHAPGVRDDAAVARLYRRIGFRGADEFEFDTVRAHEIAQQVRRELWYGTPSSRP